jgi:hypothetical protein
MPNPSEVSDPSRAPASLRDLDYLERRVAALEARLGGLQEVMAMPAPTFHMTEG